MRDTTGNVKSLFDISPSAIVCFYKIDLKGKGSYLFHAGENGYRKCMIFNGEKYDFFPIKVDGFEVQGGGKLPRPKMTFSNHQGNISIRLGAFKDFINYKVTRIKTFVKFLDNENFPDNVNPHADPNPDASFSEDIFYVNQKIKEDDNIVEFELVSLLELQNARVPARIMYSNYCGWQYRSNIGCKYKGKPIADGKNKRFVPSGYSGAMVGSEVYLTGEVLEQEFAKTGEDGFYSGWNRSIKYNKGDVVRIEPFNDDKDIYPASIYVCLEDGTRSYPVTDRKNWTLDACDKTLCGCRLRFGENSTGAGGGSRGDVSVGEEGQLWTETGGNGLPFGGFPGIDPYDFK